PCSWAILVTISLSSTSLKARVIWEAPAGTKEHILQGNVTDAAFLRRLASKAGNTLRIEGKKVIIGPPPKGNDVPITPAGGLRKIKVKVKANTQVGEVTVHAWDPKTK